MDGENKNAVEQNVEFLKKLIVEFRKIITPLKLMESVFEEGIVRFSPMVDLFDEYLLRLVETGLISTENEYEIRESLLHLREASEQVEGHNSIYAGLSGSPVSVPL